MEPEDLAPSRPQRLRSPAFWTLGTFLIGLLIYGTVGLSLYHRSEPRGDESAYLLLAHSIAFDGDVDLRNNIENGDYRLFYTDPQKAGHEPAVDVRGDGTVRSIHGVGLSLLIALPYRLGGRMGALLTIAIFGAIMSTTLFLIGRSVSRDLRAALVTWGLVSFTLPTLLLAGQVLPEVPAVALLLSAVYLVMTRKGPIGVRLLLCGVLLSFLPWLHNKNLLPAGVVLVWAAFRVKGHLPRRSWFGAILLLFLPMVASVGLQTGLFQRWYGSPLPNAPYRISFGWHWFAYEPDHIYRGIAGPLLDQEFGLLFYAPFYLAALAGLGPLFRRRRDLATVVLLSLAGMLLLSSAFIQWWGGQSVPARYLYPAIPLLAMPLSTALSRWRHPAFRLPFLGLALFSLLLASLFVSHSDWLPFQDMDRTARPLKEWGLERWASVFPSTAVQIIRYGAYGLPFEAGEIQTLQGKQVLYAGPEVAPGTWVQKLDLAIPRGRTRFRCRMSVWPADEHSPAPLAILRLTSGQQHTLVEREVTRADLEETSGTSFQDFDLDWYSGAQTTVTFWVYYTGAASLWLETTTVGPAQPFVDAGKVALWTCALTAIAVLWNYLGRHAPNGRPAEDPLPGSRQID